MLRRAEQDLDKKHAGQHDLRDLPVPALPAPESVPSAPGLSTPLPALSDLPEAATSPLALADLPGGQSATEEPSDLPLDAGGNPLEHEPNATAPPIFEAPMDQITPTLSRGVSAGPDVTEPDTKKLKLTPSGASSRRSSFASVPALMSRQVTPSLASLPPVPEDEDPAFMTPRPEALDDPREAQGDDTVSKHASLLVHETYTINSKSFCEFCGCLEKQIEAGKVQCSRCFSFKFTDHPEQVQNWFDEDLEYDARVKRWRSLLLQQADDAHLPDQTELQEIWRTGVWHDNETHRSLSAEKSECITASPLRSEARWSKTQESWIWCTLANVNTEVDGEEGMNYDFTKVVTIHHSSHKKVKSNAKVRVLKHKNLLRGHQPEQVWLLRHGRSDAYRRGWDGTSQEFQPMFQGNQNFKKACLFANWEDDLKVKSAVHDAMSSSTAPITFQSFVSNDTSFQAFPDTSDEEDAGLKRTQRQALKRELPWKSISESDRQACVDAMAKEWAEWCKWSSCQKFEGDASKVSKELILPSRVCYRWKPIDGGSSFKAKARIVIQGFRDPHLPLLSRDAPVLSRIGLMSILQWASSNNLNLWNGDCKSAFLQGKPDLERPQKIYMRVPQDGIALAAVPEWNVDRNQLYVLHAPVYGQANAPRQWFLHVLDVMNRLNWVQHSLDPCVFLYKNSEDVVTAVLGIHVDDIIACSLFEDDGVLKGVESHGEDLGRKMILFL